MCTRRPTRGVLIGLATLLVLSGTGCATAKQSWRAGPAGIPAERSLREQLLASHFDAAWASVQDRKLAPADALLRHMYKGVVAVQAGEFETGARAMDRAWELTEERWTKRASDAALAMVTSDAALPYYPGMAERLFIPYYGALNWLARNERTHAAVEARRLSSLLESDEQNPPEPRLRGVMRYVAGVTYELAGERNDAQVSFRNAALLLDGALPGDTLPADALHGDVVIFLEDGFVGRPAPQVMTYWFNDDELALLTSEDDSARLATATVLHRRRYDSRYDDDHWRSGSYRSVALTWPGFDDSDHGSLPLGARAIGAGASAESANRVAGDPAESGFQATGDPGWFDGAVADVVIADVTASVHADFDRRQPMRLARAIARAAVRDAAMVAAGKSFESAAKADDKSEDDDDDKDGGLDWGKVLLGIGLFATSATSAILDQPDLRAWQVLPDRVGVARMRLPVGEHVIEVTRGSQVISLGTVSVLPGSVTLLTHRWFGVAPSRCGAGSLHPAGRAADMTLQPASAGPQSTGMARSNSSTISTTGTTESMPATDLPACQ